MQRRYYYLRKIARYYTMYVTLYNYHRYSLLSRTKNISVEKYLQIVNHLDSNKACSQLATANECTWFVKAPGMNHIHHYLMQA